MTTDTIFREESTSPRPVDTMPALGLAEPGGGLLPWVVPAEPHYDPALGQYVALTPGGVEVYEDTYTKCVEALGEHIEAEAAHQALNGWDPMVPDYEALAAEARQHTAAVQDRDGAF